VADDLGLTDRTPTPARPDIADIDDIAEVPDGAKTATPSHVFRFGISDAPDVVEAFERAGVDLSTWPVAPSPGDSVFLGVDQVNDDLIDRLRQSPMPGVAVFLVTPHPDDGEDPQLRRWARELGGDVLAVPYCVPYLRGFITRLHAATVTARPATPRPVRARLTVTTTVSGDADQAPQGLWDRLRAGFNHTGLPWPDLHMTVTWPDADPTRPPQLVPPGAEADLAVAAAVLAATSAAPADRLPHCAFLGQVSPDGQIRPVPDLAALLATLPPTGLTRAVVPTGHDRTPTPPGVALHPVADIDELVAFLH
jgi:hypothetical protein